MRKVRENKTKLSELLKNYANGIHIYTYRPLDNKQVYISSYFSESYLLLFK